jgi:ribonuclease HI
MQMARFEAWFDGACHNKKNEYTPMGYGYLIKEEGELLFEKHDSPSFLGTSNIAEWLACLDLLLKIEELVKKPSEIHVFGDSQLIIKQLTGEWACYDAILGVIWAEARQALKRLEKHHTIKIKHVRRQFNKEADKLSKIGLEGSKTKFS